MPSRFLADNLFDTSIYPDHVLDAEEEASGKEVERIADGRRASRDNWEPTTANSQTWAEVTCNRVRSADLLIIDREHNLGDIGIELRVSQDDFTTYTTPLDVTVPASTFSSSPYLAGSAVRTWEGAIVIPFDEVAGTYWRLYVDAMGAGLVPRISGVWLGKSWSPSIGPLLAGFDDEAGDLSVPGVVTPALWSGTGRVARRRTPSLSYLVADETEWLDLRYHVDLYHRGLPMWVIQQEHSVERAVLARSSGGAYSVPFTGNRVGRDLSLSLPEYQPRARRAT